MANRLFTLMVALASATAVVVATEVQVTIYYESLCPDSLTFFKQQFVPVYNSSSFKKYIKPSFVPWGKANITDGALHCQHGNLECDGNRLQACGLHVINTPDVAAMYIGCLMSLNITQSTITVYPNDQCKDAAGAFYNDIQACYTNISRSTSYLKSYGDLTDKAFSGRNLSVPYASFNNSIDDSVSAEAVKNFQKSICNNLKSENLKECGNSATTFTATLIPAAILFFLGRL